jgi:hypothetical protein
MYNINAGAESSLYVTFGFVAITVEQFQPGRCAIFDMEEDHKPKHTVANSCHATTVTSKHAPTIRLQKAKRCFLRVLTSWASPRLVCCHATAINTWITQEWGRVTWSRQQWRHAFQQWRKNWSVSRVSDQGHICETEARLWVSSRWDIAVLDWRQPWMVLRWRIIEDFNCEWKTFFVCNI